MVGGSNFMSNDVLNLRKTLSLVNLNELKRKIYFFKADISKNEGLSYSKARQKIYEVLSFAGADGWVSCTVMFLIKMEKNTKFYRVRTIPEGEKTAPFSSMSNVSDCWIAPSNLVSKGRVNKAHEPLLYVCPEDEKTPLIELKIKDKQWFSLIEYQSLEPIETAQIGAPPPGFDYSVEEIEKLRGLQNVLVYIFTLPTDSPTGSIYMFSEIIAKDYYDLPHDGWTYPSVATGQTWNTCLKKESLYKLKVLSIRIAELNSNKDNFNYQIKYKAEPIDGSKELVFTKY
jgi:hypothetical protein